jgi:hypothetical protein
MAQNYNYWFNNKRVDELFVSPFKQKPFQFIVQRSKKLPEVNVVTQDLSNDQKFS